MAFTNRFQGRGILWAVALGVELVDQQLAVALEGSDKIS